MIRGDSEYSNVSTPQVPSIPIASIKDIPQYNQHFDLVCGFMRKRTPNKSWLNISWSKRWFWINLDIPEKGNYTLCYADRESRLILKPKRMFHLVGAKVVVHNSRTFSLHFPNNVVTLQCASPQECLRWTSSLAHIIAVADIRAEALYKLKSTSDIDLASHFFNRSNEDMASLSTNTFSEMGSMRSVPSESNEDFDGSHRGSSEDVTVSLWGEMAPHCSRHVHHRPRRASPPSASLSDEPMVAAEQDNAAPMTENTDPERQVVDSAAVAVPMTPTACPTDTVSPTFLQRVGFTSLYAAEVFVAFVTWNAVVVTLITSAFCLATGLFVANVIVFLVCYLTSAPLRQ